MSARFVYDVYDVKSSLPIIIGGTARECAKMLGITENQFRHYVINSNHGKRMVIKNVVEQRYNKFGTRCRNARMAAGLTQAQVADAVGISIPTYKKYEQGVSLPNVETTVRIAQVLKVSIRYLTGGFYEQEKE
jgi:DNA-binding XRE family transcriptional regulator